MDPSDALPGRISKLELFLGQLHVGFPRVRPFDRPDVSTSMVGGDVNWCKATCQAFLPRPARFVIFLAGLAPTRVTARLFVHLDSRYGGSLAAMHVTTACLGPRRDFLKLRRTVLITQQRPIRVSNTGGLKTPRQIFEFNDGISCTGYHISLPTDLTTPKSVHVHEKDISNTVSPVRVLQ